MQLAYTACNLRRERHTLHGKSPLREKFINPFHWHTPHPVALVGAAGTFANAAIFIQAGDIWRETLAPGAAWYVLCAAGKTATVNVVGVA